MPNEKNEKLENIRKSIKHWMLDIVRPLKKGDRIIRIINDWENRFTAGLKWEATGKKTPTGSLHCSLCVAYLNDLDCLIDYLDEINDYATCGLCPLSQLTGLCCGEERSAYNIFYYDPTLANAKNMVCDLVCTYWAEVDKIDE